MRCGFIGLGNLGAPPAASLLRGKPLEDALATDLRAPGFPEMLTGN